MEFFDNQQSIVSDDLKKKLKRNSKVSVAAGCFSIYAYKELRKELENIEEIRFLFTSPTFTSDIVSDGSRKDKKVFFIPKLDREKSIYGTEFEIKLRNEMTLKAISKECAEWVKKKVVFKSNSTNKTMLGMLNVMSEENVCSYYPFNEFTTVGIGCDKGNMICNPITRFDAAECTAYLKMFDSVWNNKDEVEDVTQKVIDNFTTVYNENSPEFIYFMTLYNIFSEFLDDINEDVLPDDHVGFKDTVIWNKLYDFQKDAALAIINKLEKYNGCILADSVGLGKTFTALAVIKYYEMRNKSVLVLCPKKLGENWNTYCSRYKNNPLVEDRLNYTVLYHTDLSRTKGESNGYDLNRVYWENFNLVVIDESHNFKNGIDNIKDDKQNRYQRLLEGVVKKGVQTKVLMLSATPVNNRFNDLRNQLALAYEGDPRNIDDKLNTSTSINKIFSDAQAAFNKWSKLPTEARKTDRLLDDLSFDFFEVLDSVTIARSRKHIIKYYNMDAIGRFPERRKPISMRPGLTDLEGAPGYNEIYAELLKLNLEVYTPSKYIFPVKIEKYDSQYGKNISMSGREEGIRALMRIGLLKRLESSVNSFDLTLGRVLDHINSILNVINEYEKSKERGSFGKTPTTIGDTEIDDEDLDYDDQNIEFIIGKKVKIDLRDMDWMTWRNMIESDVKILGGLKASVDVIDPRNDKKLMSLFDMVSKKIQDPFNSGNKKLLIFTAFSDTAEYIYDNLSNFVKEKYNLNTGMITGSTDGKTTIPKIGVDMNLVLSCFSPISKERDALFEERYDLDILVATDCISEGQNLQDCDCVINYDIHWNPVRIIQRFGRVDRIGSKNASIQLVNFWPDIDLDEYINLKSRVEIKMKLSVATSTGDDDPINMEEHGELEYRKKQLEQLQKENVDLEDISGGVSIMDLGLNEFRMDLVEYVKDNPGIERAPHGMNAVVASDSGHPCGVIFVLKNVNEGVNIDSRNRLHPFYMVYIGLDGNVIFNHLKPKLLLDTMRFLCKGKCDADADICAIFNEDTDEGRNMSTYSKLLKDAVSSIIDTNDKSDIDSLFSGGKTTALINDVSGLNDFELICFLAVR